MHGHRGPGAGWLVFIIVLIVVAGLAVLGAVMQDQRDAAEQTVTDGRTPTADVFEPPQGNRDDGDGMPGTPRASSAGPRASARYARARMTDDQGLGTARSPEMAALTVERVGR
jgi:hypothetical protein